MTSLEDAPDEIEGLPPSAKLTYLVLKHQCPLSQQDVVEQTRLPERTARYALDRLVDAGLVETRPVPGDARQTWYEPEGGW